MVSALITEERRESFAIVRLSRPDKLNALSREMIFALSDTFTRIAGDSDVRAVILTGSGEKAFCAGTDIDELSATADHTNALKLSARGQALCNQIENCGTPVIAAVNGLAAGGGCELALACHIRIASTNAQFSLPEPSLALFQPMVERNV